MGRFCTPACAGRHTAARVTQVCYGRPRTRLIAGTMPVGDRVVTVHACLSHAHLASYGRVYRTIARGAA
ncbi:hypothetical protein [Streptomyces specialis]|uniref:hypothetical protein n=1 Tax=Streptomyces specialis TaxID=498367 RepID=UPI00073F244F|nr:hypothetical protein [Streptomyces specialis]